MSTITPDSLGNKLNIRLFLKFIFQITLAELKVCLVPVYFSQYHCVPSFQHLTEYNIIITDSTDD